MKKKFMLVILLIIMFCTTSCFKRDDLEDINIYTTIYPIEFLTEKLYGYNSNVLSIYPNGASPKEYKLSKKKIRDYATSSSLLVYNGLSDEKNIAASFLNNNKDMKIIDVSQGLTTKYYEEELWLNPTNFLMMASNIRKGLKEYISNQYILEEIDENYSKLKEDISALESELALIIENTDNKNILVGSDLFLFLEKYGYIVTSLDETNVDNLSNNVVNKAKRLITDKSVSYIFLLDNQKPTDKINELIKNTNVKVVYIKTFANLSSEERSNNQNYITLMNENIEAIRKEMYE